MDAPVSEIVVIGGGHACAQLCAALRAAGDPRPLRVLGAEPQPPYQRPPLSKAFLAGGALQPLRPADWWGRASVTLELGDPVVAIDRQTRRVSLRSGAQRGYAHLVLATGARARWPAGLPRDLRNALSLRDATDAAALRERLAAVASLTILGGGYVGLEVAAAARKMGKRVTLLERAPRLLERSASPQLAAALLAQHSASGVDLRLNTAVDGFELDGDRVVALRIGATREPVELLLVAIGAEPEQDLARDAGLQCDGGIVVDELLRTSDPHVSALGDCVNFVDARAGRMRLESIQNAGDQARALAATLTGRAQAYAALPTFWSDQGDCRLQIAGLLRPGLQCRLRPGATLASFSLLHYDGDALVCVESVNAPADHAAARRLLADGTSPPPDAACDPARPLGG